MMDVAIYGFFTALGLVLLILGAVIRGSADTANKEVSNGSDKFSTAIKNVNRSGDGIIVIGVFMFVLSGFMLYRHIKGDHSAKASAPVVAQPVQSFKRYYF